MAEPGERRARVRLRLRRQIRIRRFGKHERVHTYTENVSSAGFYCVVPEPFSPGEDLDCLLSLEAGPFSAPAARLLIHAQVRWTATLSQGASFAIGCKIITYMFLRGAEQGSEDLDPWAV